MKHRDRIYEIFDEMFSLLPVVLPENRVASSNYLSTVWAPIIGLVESVEEWDVDEGLSAKFQSFIDNQTADMKRNLGLVKYDIDDMTTLKLVAGSGGIEKVTIFSV